MNTAILGKPLLGRYYVRSMANCDLRAVEYVEKTSTENFWTIEDFRRMVKLPGVQGRVITDDSRIVAFFVYELDKSDVHILNFAVHPEHRRKGLGSAMVGVLKNRLNEKRCNLKVNVRETNLFAQYFLQKNNFKATSVERNYFMDYPVIGDPKIEDAYTFLYPYLEECDK